MVGDMVIDILRCIGLIVHQKTALADSEILDQYGVGSYGGFAGVPDIEAPEPRSLVRMQRQCHAMTNAAGLALPHKAIFGHAKPDVGAWSDNFDAKRRRVATSAQNNPANAAIERRAKNLADHDGRVFEPVFDREDAAVRDQADS